jgi:hypothetical protein
VFLRVDVSSQIYGFVLYELISAVYLMAALLSFFSEFKKKIIFIPVPVLLLYT